MTITLTPQVASDLAAGPIGQSGLAKILARAGRFPSLSLTVKPLLASQNDVTLQLSVDGKPLTKFISYQFQSSVIVPVDSFSFSWSSPDAQPVTRSIFPGDLVVLIANGIELATGIVDQMEVDTDGDSGEKVTLSGRDLMSQLEDQDAISLDSSTVWLKSTSLLAGVQKLCENTRIQSAINLVGNTPTRNDFLLATEPGESKLAALQRFLEPLNCIAWMAPNGRMNVGKPNMTQTSSGRFIVSRSQRTSNCLSMRVTRSPTTIPNVIIPIWTGQETTVDRVATSQALTNTWAKDASRLYKLGHRVPKTVVVSTPDGDGGQGISFINSQKAGGANIIEAYAKREIARRNISELKVEVVVPGHFRDDGTPYAVDTIYQIVNDRSDIDENMYLYQLEYDLTDEGGQRTTLSFCRLGSIVADNLAPGVGQ